jgi:hypothetical protein
MNIYLAAQFKEQALMMQWAIFLRHHNHFITSRWLLVNEADEKKPSKEVTNAGIIDLEDIDASEIVISQTLKRGELFTGGGRHIEFGYAFAKGKKLINVGGYESAFHHLPNVITVPTIEEVLQHLK